MSKSIALGLLGAGAILLAILLTGCSDAPSPTTEPTATSATVLTPTPEPTPTTAAAALTLGVYLTLCAPTESDLADDTTFGDFSSLYAAAADRLEALTPPAQLSEWHLLLIEAIRAAQAGVDTQPQDDVVDFDNPTMNAVFDDFEEKLREAAARVPRDVLQRMIEADCIDPDVAPDDYADLPDDHGDSEGEATAIRVGADVRGAVDYDDDIDFFRFQAERGQSYQIDVALGTLDDSIVDLYDSDGSYLDSNDDYGDTFASRLYWEAPSSGERYVLVGGYGIGTYTLTVSLSDIIDDHGNSEGEATAIRVGADVRGAVDYDDDIDFFRFQAERGQSYQIDVALGTLDDSIVDLYDADGSYLDASYDYGDPYASRLYWEAPSSGERYVAVYGYGTGTYTLTVSHSTIVDDHGDDIDDATVAATPLSLDEYLTLCVTTELELADDATFGDLSSELAAEADRFEALTPPAQLSEWHLLNIEGFRTIQAFVELQPKDDVIDFGRFFLMAAISADSEEKLSEAASRLPEDVLQQMIEAGCIDPEDLPDNYEAVPDDHGNDIGDATAIRVGADVRGALDYDDDIDFFRFQAEQGQSYQIDVALGTLDDSIVDLYDGDWSFLDSNDDYETFASRLFWEAPSSGERYVAVYGYGTGTYTLTVSLSTATPGPTNTPQSTATPRPTTPASSLVSVSAGWDHTCGVRSDGSVACWGRYDSGQSTPPAGSFVSVSAGGGHTCGVRGDGSVACWGGYDVGQSTPPAGSFDSVSAGVAHTCGVRSDGSVACWGSDSYGKAAPPAGSFVSVSAGGGHTCGVRGDGSVACWGRYDVGQSTPPAGSFDSVSAGVAHTCGVRSDGSVACWGSDSYGKAAPPAGSFVSVSAGGGHTCGVRGDGSVACWGRDDDGQATPPAGSFDSVSAGVAHTCGVRSDGSVACWGDNSDGQATPPE